MDTSTDKTDFSSLQYDDLEDHIQCMICFEPMKRSVLTRCGHRYCYDCLSKSLDRSPYCPCCRRELDMDEFFDDYQFNSLVEKLLSQRDSIDRDKMSSTTAKSTNQPDKDKEEIQSDLKLKDFFDVFIRKEYILIFALGYTDWFFSLSVALMTYASINAMESKEPFVDMKFLRIWNVYGIFRTGLVLSDYLFYWIPFYWGAKSVAQTIFLALCFVPMSWNGTRLVYNRLVKPFLLLNRFYIDKVTEKIRFLVKGDQIPVFIFYLIIGFFAQFLTSFMGFVCPAYMAFKAIESEKREDQTRCHIYCVVYNVLVLMGILSDLCIFWIPFYWQLKLLVLLGCTVPTVWNGSFFYHKVILRGFKFVKKCQDSITPHLQNLSRAGRQHVE